MVHGQDMHQCNHSWQAAETSRPHYLGNDFDFDLSLGKKRAVAQEDRLGDENLFLNKRTRVETPLDGESDAQSVDGFAHKAVTSIEALPTDQALPLDNVVCFGKLALQISSSALSKLRNCASAVTVRDGKLWHDNSNALLGALPSRATELIELFQRSAIDVELHNNAVRSYLLPSSQKSRSKPVESVYIILYGRRGLGDPLNQFLESAEIFLQDPVGALRDEVYWNPQRMFNDPDCRTSSLTQPEPAAARYEALDPKDFLSSFTSNGELEETEGSQAVVTPLLSHQKQALTFLLARERGWQYGSGQDVWTFASTDETAAGTKRDAGLYINEVTQESHREPPPEFRGGIIADTMGSGKSLAMIALVAHDMVVLDQNATRRPTLFVVPPQLVGTWNTEFSKHLHPGVLTWLSRCTSRDSMLSPPLGSADIVLTTYEYLARAWRKEGKSHDMFTCFWRRIILDEAHYIKNETSLRTQAVYHLRAERRWAVTGTPIQNSLLELHSLLRFIRAYPYDDKHIFDDHIRNQWASGWKQGSIDRLKRLLSSVMLRRVGQHIDLPARKDLRVQLEFTLSEHEAYRSAAQTALKFIDDALESSSCSRPGSHLNAMQKITSLRRICNHGTAKPLTQFEQNIEKPHDTGWDSSSALAAMHNFSMFGSALVCRRCHRAVEQDQEVRLTECLRIYCKACGHSSLVSQCDCQLPCAIADVDLSETTDGGLVASPGSTQASGGSVYPTKICALLNDLEQLPVGAKSIVFSAWTSTLDLTRHALSQAGVVCEQVDGRVTTKERENIFSRFQNNKSVQVLLLSLSCGAVGLTLTAATRAYLMEPQWNPSIEEQALARIHRLGQTRPITTVRFMIKSTIEEYIVSVQEKKTDLVQALLSPTSRNLKSMLKELKDFI